MNSIDSIIDYYEKTLKPLDADAKKQNEKSYGGYVRFIKGKLLEDMTQTLVELAWQELKGRPSDIEINRKKIKIPIKQDYIDSIEDSAVKSYIKKNIGSYNYGLSVDKHVYIRGKFILAIECKAYAENAMMKRICTDFYFLRKIHPDILCYLVQLESQLGGDYSKISKVTYGSKSTHAILSHLLPDLKIITLLEGERDVDMSIHEFFKPLKKEHLESALETLKNDLRKFL